MKQVLKNVIRWFLDDYQLNRIYFLNIACNQNEASVALADGVVITTLNSTDAATKSSDQRMRDHAWYGGEHAIGYGVWENQELVCIAWFWIASHPKIPQRFSDLTEHEAVMVDLLTAPQCRGKGYAVAVARYAAMDLARRGYQRVWTWVWRNNWPSISVFSKAGWIYAFFLVEIKLAGMHRYFRLTFPRGRK